MESNGWSKWENFVLAELKRLGENSDATTKTQTKILQKLSALDVKAGLWGLMGGMIPVVIGFGIYLIKS